jgi:hypothetical protein
MCRITWTLPLRPSRRPFVTGTKSLDQTALRVENDRPTGNRERQGGVYVCFIDRSIDRSIDWLILINNQLDAQFLLYIFISILYMVRATLCSSSGESVVSNNTWYMSLCVGDRPLCRSGRKFPICIPDGHLHRVTYTRCCIDTIESPDDEHKFARNMWRIEINIYKRNCAPSWLFIGIIPRCTVTRI